MAHTIVELPNRARASGVALEQPAYQVWTWRERKVWRNVACLDPAQVREAFGA